MWTTMLFAFSAAAALWCYKVCQWHLYPAYKQFQYRLWSRKFLATFEGLSSQKKEILRDLLDRWVDLKVAGEKGSVAIDVDTLEKRISNIAEQLLYEDIEERFALIDEAETDLDSFLGHDFDRRLEDATDEDETQPNDETVEELRDEIDEWSDTVDDLVERLKALENTNKKLESEVREAKDSSESLHNALSDCARLVVSHQPHDEKVVRLVEESVEKRRMGVDAEPKQLPKKKSEKIGRVKENSEKMYTDETSLAELWEGVHDYTHG